jgi:threonine dehydratase
MPTTDELPTFDDVRSAAGRLAGVAHRTPVLRSRTVDARLGASVFFKCENLQRAGAFKFRGAYNALSQLGPEARRAGALAYSSGNHAQAVALAARLLSIPATIVMPLDAPAIKLAATRGYGAEVVTYDRYRQDREALARELADSRGLTLIPPFDHRDVIAGQGTVALELFEEVGELDALFVCLGGGGLISGCGLVARATGEIVRIDVPKTIADGAQTQSLGRLTFPLIRRCVDAIETVTDDELVDAMRFLAERMKILVEPTGCLGAAAAFGGRQSLEGQRVGVVLSGGNTDLASFCELVSARTR